MSRRLAKVKELPLSIKVTTHIFPLFALIFLMLNLLSTPITDINRFHCEANIGNVNGILTLGTFGYCLDLSNNSNTCLHPHNLLYVNDNHQGQVLAQVGVTINSTKYLASSILLGILAPLVAFGAFLCSILSCLPWPWTAILDSIGVLVGTLGLVNEFNSLDLFACHYGGGSLLSIFAVLCLSAPLIRLLLVIGGVLICSIPNPNPLFVSVPRAGSQVQDIVKHPSH